MNEDQEETKLKQLIGYIKKGFNKGIKEKEILENLIDKGWPREYIKKGILKLKLEEKEKRRKNIFNFGKKHHLAFLASDIMEKKIVKVKMPATKRKIIDALMKMVRYELRRLPVLNGKTIVGELTLHHLIIKFYNATQYHPIIEDKEG